MPRAIQRVHAMARPTRPIAERDLVRVAAAGAGSALNRARRLGRAVAEAAIADIDMDPADRVIGLLRALAASPVDRLANDPMFDTGALIVAARLARLRARGGRHLPEREWPAENREVLASVASTLARRYRVHLSDDDCCRKPVFRQRGSAITAPD
jgi:hypothetical protein